jgi:hypothetical protein
MGFPINQSRRRELWKNIQKINLKYYPRANQLIGKRMSTKLLGFFILKGLSRNYLDIQTNLEIAADHTPIIATISTHIITRQQQPKLHNSRTTGKYLEIKSKKTYSKHPPQNRGRPTNQKRGLGLGTKY